MMLRHPLSNPRARIAVAGLHAESNPRNPSLTVRSAFRVLRRDALLAHPDFTALRAIHPGLVGGIHLRAPSGGPTARSDFEGLLDMLRTDLETLRPLDGLLLATHGGLIVEGIDDGDGRWIEALRACVGNDCRVVGAFDPHSTPSERTFTALDGLVTCRTTPHTDEVATKERGLRLLDALLVHDGPTHVAWCGVPIRVPSERAASVVEPLRSLYPTLDRLPDGAWSADVFLGNAWAPGENPPMGTVAVGTERSSVQRHARRLAEHLWEGRAGFAYPHDHGDLVRTLARLDGANGDRIVIADSGDNPGGGGTGEGTDLLRALLQRDRRAMLVVGVVAPPFVAACWRAGPGAEVAPEFTDAMGPWLPPLPTPAKVVHCAPAPGGEGRSAFVTLGHVTLLLLDARTKAIEPDWLKSQGFDAAGYDVVVLKTGFIPTAYLADGARPWLALTPGVTDHGAVRSAALPSTVPECRTFGRR